MTRSQKTCFNIGLRSAGGPYPLPTNLEEYEFWWMGYFMGCMDLGVDPDRKLKFHDQWTEIMNCREEL